MGVAGCNSIMALTGVKCAICGDAADVFIGWDLVEKIRQHRRIANTAGRHLNGPYLQCFFVDPNVYLASEATFGATMFARIPLTFALGFDARAVDKQMQGAG